MKKYKLAQVFLGFSGERADPGYFFYVDESNLHVVTQNVVTREIDDDEREFLLYCHAKAWREYEKAIEYSLLNLNREATYPRTIIFEIDVLKRLAEYRKMLNRIQEEPKWCPQLDIVTSVYVGEDETLTVYGTVGRKLQTVELGFEEYFELTLNLF